MRQLGGDGTYVVDVFEGLGEGFGEEFEVGAIELGGGDEGEVAVAGDGD